MVNLWTVVLLSLLPGIGNFCGGIVAEFGKPSPRLFSSALHIASGIVVAIVAVELIPEALGSLAGWWIAIAFAGGGIAYVTLDSLVKRLQSRSIDDRSRVWMIYAAVAVDLMSDGLMIGTGSAVSQDLALALASGQMLADVPEGYAVVATFRNQNVPRRRRIFYSASFFVYVVGAAFLSYLLIRGVPEAIKTAALILTAGLLIVAAVEDILEEAHAAHEDTRWSALAFVGGFTLFILVSAGLESVLGGG